MAKGNAVCLQCSNPLPENAHYNRIFCNKTCRNRAMRKRRPEVDLQADLSRFKKKIKDREILEPTEQALYENYKEPLRKVEKGFGFFGVVAINEDRTHIQCHECGYFYKSLNGHTKTHNLSIAEYKEKYDLMKTTALIGDELREKRIEVYKNTPESHKELVKNAFESFNKSVKRGEVKAGTKKGDRKWSLEKRNKEGLCPDQLLEKIKEVAEQLGHSPTANEFRSIHTRYATAIITMFGSWNNAIKLVGFNPNKSGGRLKYTLIELIEYQKMFYKEHGRVATQSDFSRGYMPPQTVYVNRFGSLNEARQVAGLPILIPLGGRRYVEQYV